MYNFIILLGCFFQKFDFMFNNKHPAMKYSLACMVVVSFGVFS